MKNLMKKILKFKTGDHVRILKYKNTFAEGYTPNSSQEMIIVKKIQNTVFLGHILFLI